MEGKGREGKGREGKGREGFRGIGFAAFGGGSEREGTTYFMGLEVSHLVRTYGGVVNT